MSNQVDALDRDDEEILTSQVPDETLEAAAGTENNGKAAYTGYPSFYPQLCC
jgi:hypothetical protein